MIQLWLIHEVNCDDTEWWNPGIGMTATWFQWSHTALSQLMTIPIVDSVYHHFIVDLTNCSPNCNTMGNFIGNYYYNNGHDDQNNHADHHHHHNPHQHEYHQRQQQPGSQSGQSSSRPKVVSAQLESMSIRVKEVLPQVPLDVIRRDVSITANVDETITRLLDGTVMYTPEEPSNKPTIKPFLSSPSGHSSASSVSSKLPYNTAASCFGKTSGERMKSYTERKQQLIEESRLRYMIKHGLNISQDEGSDGQKWALEYL